MTSFSATNGSGGFMIPDGCVLPPFLGFLPWDNPDNLISHDTEDLLEKAVSLVALPLLFLVSTPGNVLNMIVFYRHGLRDRINLCLFFQVEHKLIGLGAGFSWVSGFISAVVATERCFCIVSPLKSKTVLKTRTMAVIILMAHLVFVGSFFLLAARYQMVCVFNPVTLTTAITPFPTQFFLDNQRFMELFEVIVFGFLSPGFCVTVVSVATLIIIVKLRKMAAWREQVSTTQAPTSRDLALTRMLVATSILFVVSVSPGLVLRVAIVLEPDLSLTGRFYNTFNLLLSLSQLLCYVNSSVNAFFYYKIGSRYRETDNLISQHTEDAVEKAVNLGALPLLFLVSTPANVLNMIVFYRHGLRERINLCLFFQSLADLIYVLHSFFMYADRLYLAFDENNNSRYGPFLRFQVEHKLIGLGGFSWVSGFISAVVATERCFCIVSPLKSKTVLKTRTMAVIILMAHLVFVGGYFVLAARYQMVCVFNPVTLTTAITPFPTQFFLDNQRFMELLEVVVYGFALPGFCVTVVSVATLIIIVKLRKMAAWREQVSTTQAPTSRDLALTRMLVATSILFVVSISPGLVLRVAIVLEPDLSLTGRFYNTFNLLLSLSQLLCYVNSSVNAFFYYKIGSRYRETSNMGFTLNHVINATEEVQTGLTFQNIRFTKAKLVESPTPQKEMAFDTPWTAPTTDTVSVFSAVCWLFGEYLYQHLQYPIGLVESAWGGTPIEAWSPPEAINDCTTHQKRGPGDNTVLWNAMINPLLGMTLYGAIWYQGEANAGRAEKYACQIKAMVSHWRSKFNEESLSQTSDSFPFGYVQLAGNAHNDEVGTFPAERWAQTANYGYSPNPDLPNTFMAVAMDLPDFDSPYGTIHPRYKQDVAKRLVLGARNVAYGEKTVVFQGPFPTSFTTKSAQQTIEVEYDDGESMLQELKGNEGFETE
nr:hypothetical protein BaRGS_022967 [Batillaria attramentaria]